MKSLPLNGAPLSWLINSQASINYFSWYFCLLRKTLLLTNDCSLNMKINGTSMSGCALQSLGSGTFLVTFTDVPSGDYGVQLRGEDNSSTTRSTPIIFQRQASTQIKTSGISLTVSSVMFMRQWTSQSW